MRLAALLGLSLLLAPALACAQDAPMATAPTAATPAEVIVPEAQAPPPPPSIDAIGDLIAQSIPDDIDEETAETAGSPEAARAVGAGIEAPVDIPAPVPAAPIPAATAPATPTSPQPNVPAYQRPVPSGIERPVMLHETGVSPDGPPDVAELTYESRVRGSIAAAQGLQGPLDGSWTLTDTTGAKLYAFQMVDPGASIGQLEGAWRDLRRGEGIGGVGVIADIQRGAGLTVRFYPRATDDAVVADLTPTAGGGWSGKLTDKGAITDVTLVRDGPAPAGYAVLGAGGGSGYAPRPYDSRVYAVARKPAAKPVKGKKGKAAKNSGAKKKSSSKKTPAKKAPAKKKK